MRKFVARKWIEVTNLSNGQCSANKNIRLKTPIQRSDLRDYSDVYIVFKGRMTVMGTNNVNTNLDFKLPLFIDCFLKAIFGKQI